jgi:sigma-54 specific flagellar transcriptional regulator A
MDNLIIGQSAAIAEVKRLIRAVAAAPTTVLVQGETGTGKELAAKALHETSGRRGQMISVNCAAIPSELLESELFGHEKGAFTGAERARPGRFEQADGGTLFLDEIGDMPIALQSKLLRALEEKTIQRVGGDKMIPVDFRLVCATHQNIETKINEGSFRADLYYRINVFPIQLPSLAERSVDVPLLVQAMTDNICAEKTSQPKFDDSALQELSRYPWPGNIRELRNVLERATILFASRPVSNREVRENLLRLKAPDTEDEQKMLWEVAGDFDALVDVDAETIQDKPLPHPAHYQDWFAYFDQIDLRRHLRDVEVVLIEAALQRYAVVSQAAAALKLRRTTLIEKMKKLSIEKPLSDSQAD